MARPIKSASSSSGAAKLDRDTRQERAEGLLLHLRMRAREGRATLRGESLHPVGEQVGYLRSRRQRHVEFCHRRARQNEAQVAAHLVDARIFDCADFHDESVAAVDGEPLVQVRRHVHVAWVKVRVWVEGAHFGREHGVHADLGAVSGGRVDVGPRVEHVLFDDEGSEVGGVCRKEE
eukprot:scaffold95168_cov59-Phaeocystis_antarctica.AAC.5